MSRQGANKSRPFWGDPRPDYGAIERAARGTPRHGSQLTKEESEEVHRQSREVLREMKKLGCANVLLPATIIPHRMLLNAWNSWCIVMLVVIVTEASAQDL